MRNEDEIRQRLKQIKQDLEEAEAWFTKAYTNYEDERRTWSKNADRREMYAASDAATNCVNKIRLLEWVLDDAKPAVPVNFNTDEGDE